MYIIENIAILLIAFLHLYILIIEIFLWDKPTGLRAFGLEKDFAASTKVLAANQGVYNGFLAAGLVLGVIVPSDLIKLFFLSCVFIAGIFGGITSNKKIIFIQSVPASIAIILVVLKFFINN